MLFDAMFRLHVQTYVKICNFFYLKRENSDSFEASAMNIYEHAVNNFLKCLNLIK